MAEVEIPSYFLCPISLQMMRDPVTLPTGISFDRQSIERWLFSDAGHQTCPVTNQLLPSSVELTPNHTLRRLIQAWCVANASHGVERIPTPRPQIDRSHISNLLQKPNHSTSLHELQQIISASEANRRIVQSSEAVEFVVSSIILEQHGDEALAILHSLQISDDRFITLLKSNPRFLDSLFAALNRSSYKSRAYATLLLKSIVPLVSPIILSSVIQKENLHQIVSVVNDRISSQATKAALRVLIELFCWGRNRAKAVNVGAVSALIDLLLDESDGRACELALVALDKLCACAEGRAVLIGHAAGVAVVSKKILRVSAVASERAVRIVEKVAKLSASPAVLQEMVQVGVVSKLCLLLQVECGAKQKERAKGILRLHARIWKNSPCLSPALLLSYPCS
ncbi:E3 ubiquitin-protein ligase PUB23-like [Dendrobium catenatum]|uniref:U-box domain-containing protein n=1 Tax=Dendrobium catenatum TaxID=906689 RepID=A0A2I0W170_9ASPA|nr:E3 ubiquitin-protein ligase PUB23-like [Dendrobium catenatum]PKU69405.1 E3 ubiquitin-protein ligase PUB23 [Dendrobium catenatum]